MKAFAIIKKKKGTTGFIPLAILFLSDNWNTNCY